MPKIARKKAQIFADSAAAGNYGVAQFGSLAANNPTFSKDPDVIQSLPAYKQGWNSAVIGDQSPAMEDRNALDYVNSRQIAYMLQQGIPEWLSTETYYKNAYVVDSNGDLRKSLIDDNTGNDPALDTTNINWGVVGGSDASFPMFYATYQPRKLNNASWLRADPYSWHSADVYVSAYAHLADNISGVTAQTETIAGTTITFYPLSDEIKVVLPDQETNLDTIYNATGIGYYFVLDTTNRQFKLPRNIYGFTGYRGDVGGYVAESLPQHTHSPVYLTGSSRDVGDPGNLVITAAAESNGIRTITDSSTGNASSSVYQSGAPVQQRATQAYLYFYVGNTVQNETSVDVAEMTEALNGKVDLASSWGTLSTTYDNLTEPSNNGYIDITAPADGWLYYARRKSSGDSNTNMWAVNTSHTEAFQVEHDGYWGGTLVSILFPVKKGNTIRFGRNNLTGDFMGCRFYYAQKTN